MATKKKGGQPKNKNAEKWTEKSALKLGHELLAWMRDDNKNVLYKAFLFIDNDYPVNILQNLSEKFESFRELKNKAHVIQEVKLQMYSNSRMFNPTMAIFSLKNNHGYTDRMDHTTKDEKVDNKIQVEIIRNE